MAEEEYELLPHKEIEELKEQLKILKEKPEAATGTMAVNVDQLNDSIVELTNIFKEAQKEMKADGEDKESLSKKIGTLINKLDSVVDQNEKIAEGLVSIAEMVTEFTQGKKPVEPEAKPASPGFGGHEPFSPGPSQGVGMPPPGNVPSLPGEPPQMSVGDLTKKPSAPGPVQGPRNQPSVGMPPPPGNMPPPGGPGGMPPPPEPPKEKKGFFH